MADNDNLEFPRPEINNPADRGAIAAPLALPASSVGRIEWQPLGRLTLRAIGKASLAR